MKTYNIRQVESNRTTKFDLREGFNECLPEIRYLHDFRDQKGCSQYVKAKFVPTAMTLSETLSCGKSTHTLRIEFSNKYYNAKGDYKNSVGPKNTYGYWPWGSMTGSESGNRDRHNGLCEKDLDAWWFAVCELAAEIFNDLVQRYIGEQGVRHEQGLYVAWVTSERLSSKETCYMERDVFRNSMHKPIRGEGFWVEFTIDNWTEGGDA